MIIYVCTIDKPMSYKKISDFSGAFLLFISFYYFSYLELYENLKKKHYTDSTYRFSLRLVQTSGLGKVFLFTVATDANSHSSPCCKVFFPPKIKFISTKNQLCIYCLSRLNVETIQRNEIG